MTTDFRPYTASQNLDENGLTPQNGAALPSDDAAANALTDRGLASGTEVKERVHVTRPSQFGWLQWFSNLSVQKKQLAGLFTSEVISVLGLVGVGSLLIISGGRSQLLNQAKSELAVTDITYNIKINQMGFGFRGQADNRAIVDAAVATAAGQPLSATAIADVRQILENEIEARNIEYATLVGADLNIIANANRDRRGQPFDPNGLVGTVLQNPRQIKTTSIVSWEELSNEAPPLPDGFADQDALIRYTVTPVSNPVSGAVVGVLVSGDIVNGKGAIPQGSIDPFGNGYSAVYQRGDDGQFKLATALYAGDNANLEQAQADIPLDNLALVTQATTQPEQNVTRRDRIDDKTYTLAAQAVEDFGGEPVAVMVRGVSETNLNALIVSSLQLQLLIALLALVADAILAGVLGRSILRPMKNLQQATWRFGMGDRQARAEVFATDEVGQVAQAFNQLAENIAGSEDLLFLALPTQQVF
ncbi:MAG: HAMP domain-containing protein, partial [Cyanobacteria bacterium J06638_6]